MARRNYSSGTKDGKRGSMRFVTEDTTYKYEGRPEAAKDGTVKDHLSIVSLKDLPHSSFSFKADPFQAALPTSEPYPILNKFNRIVSSSYNGDDNIDGGNVQQYSNSITSKFLSYFDVFRTKLNLNYRYLPSKPMNGNYAGKALIDEMRQSIAESVSVLQSTTYTQMAINNFAVETDLPMGSASTVTVDGTNLYTNTTDVLYAMSIYYQIFMQEALSCINCFNNFRSRQGTMIRNAWNREVPTLNSLFGLFNKKAFLSKLESINLSFEGEYIDVDFMKQLNTLTGMPSRRSNSITDPVLELQCGFNHPTIFKVWLLDANGNKLSVVFNDADMRLTVGSSELTFWQAADSIRDYLSMEATTFWARTHTDLGTIIDTDNARYNYVNGLFNVIIQAFTYFKPKWADYRETLDVMTRTGSVSWTKGFKPGIWQNTDLPLFWNMLVDHVYQLIYSGPNALGYDSATKRFRTFSLWDMYRGIPEYDSQAGGSFLTFSCKSLPSGDIEEIKYLPILFDLESQPQCIGVSRDGKEATISQYSTIMDNNVVLSRLAPLSSQNSLEIRVPTLAFSTGTNSALTNPHRSALYKTLCQIFGLARIQAASNGAYDLALDPDIIAIYQIEVTDITNMAITYARANAPFRGTVSKAGLLGFSGK